MMQDILFSEPTARAVCWMLIHSLWQGVLIAGLAGLIIFCTRKLPAVLRYNMLVGDLLLFVLLAGMTFCYELREDDTVRGPAAGPVVAGVAAAVSVAAKPDAGITVRYHSDLLRSVSEYLNTHAGLITGAWLICLSLQLLRLSGGLYQVRRIRRKGDEARDGYWVARLSVLAGQLGIRRPVGLLQSAGVRTPAAIGWLKPAILVPLGLLSRLPADQVESILLHELAHIRRNDYITNLALHLIEALFFFNPGLRWVGALLRREREACCDDIVLAGVPDRNSYLEALLGFTQWMVDEKRFGAAAFAPQLGGSRTDLLWRVRRMLNQENKKLQPAEKLILSFGLMMLLSVSLLSMHRAPQPVRTVELKPVRAVASQPIHAVASQPIHAVASQPMRAQLSDTIPAVQEQPIQQKITIEHLSIHSDNSGGMLRYHAIATDKGGTRYEIRRKNGEVTEFRLNDRLIPASDYSHYTAIFESIETQRKQIAKPPTPPTPDALIPEAPIPTAPIPLVPALATPIPAAPVSPAPDSTLLRLAQLERHLSPLVEPVDVGEHQPTPEDPMVWSKYRNPYVGKILRDLLRDGLIGDLNHLSFTLNAHQLIVNGVRQPDNIFQTYRQKYIGAPTDHTIYSQEYTPHSSGSHCECVHEPEMPAQAI